MTLNQTRPLRDAVPAVPLARSGEADTLAALVNAWAQQTPTAPALLAPQTRPLNYAELLARMYELGDALGARGLGPKDAVAIVLPNGPLMAVTFLGVAAFTTAAPLNPGYRGQEFDFYLEDLNARACLVLKDLDSPIREVARARNIPLIELEPDLDGPAGAFRPLQGLPPVAIPAQPASADDVGLVLHTSGTTSRPKMVPLTHRNLFASARHIRTTLKLTPADRCLNIMPLFHIHGLMAALLASLSAGGQVVCSPGFYALQFFSWVDEFHPTWYTAVPTMHQEILARAGNASETIARNPLRFVRSSSAALAPQVMQQLEQVLNAPVIEAYGMTEASHQMASNPLPPGARKAGTAGLAAGPEIAIMDADGALLAAETRGEIVIRGPNVTAGYVGNPKANAAAFTNDWFRTGDQGYLDAAGYLRITGRLKELINRAGEKIAPRMLPCSLAQSPLAPLRIQYGDYAVWQHSPRLSESVKAELRYWRAQLQDPPPLDLELDHPRPPLQSSHGAQVVREIPRDRVHRSPQ